MGIGMTLAYAFEQQVLRAMPSLAGTPNVDWFVEQFCQPEKKEAEENNTELFQSLEKHIGQIAAGCDGLIYHPYINPGGERAPFVKTSAAAQFFGLSSNHTRWHLLRAVYEGVALSLFDCFVKFPVSISRLMLCGGGAQSALWCQIISDATGKPVHIPGGCELGALGTAVMTGLATGIYPNVKTAVAQALNLAAGYQPNLENHQIYRELHGLYKNLYQHVWDDWDLRAAILKRLEKD
jgi:xylulokinase/L-xylulokinase